MLITRLRHRRQGENSIGSAPAKSDGAEESCRLEAVDAAEALGIDAQIAQVAGTRLAVDSTALDTATALPIRSMKLPIAEKVVRLLMVFSFSHCATQYAPCCDATNVGGA